MRGISSARALAIVIATVVAVTLLRLVEQSGPLYFVPVVLAGLLLGSVAGLATGLVCSGLWLVTHTGEIEALAVITRVVIYTGVGWIVGMLAQSRHSLHGQLRSKNLELEELRTIQEALAPSGPPDRPALELATCYLPAEHGVSGDFFVVAPGRENSTVIAIGDVAGRGLEAAKRAWYVRTLIASSADQTDDPASMLERANSSLIRDSGFAAPFVTVACLVFQPHGKVEWALAGHDQPISLDGRDASPFRRAPAGLPLGVADRLGCETATAPIAPGDGILLYTDGLTEARRAANGGAGGEIELFGEERVARLVTGLTQSAPGEVVEAIRGEVSRFSGGRLADDLCLIALRAVPDRSAVGAAAPEERAVAAR